MLKKLLYLYNDGHNPFPHIKGHGFGPVQDPNHPDRYEPRYFADDDMTQEEADRRNAMLLGVIDEYNAQDEQLKENEELYPERYIPTVPTKQEYDIEKYIEKYEDEHPMEDYDDELEEINEEIQHNESVANKMVTKYAGVKPDELKKLVEDLFKDMEQLSNREQEIKSDITKLVSKIYKAKKKELAEAYLELRNHPLIDKLTEKITDHVFKKSMSYDMVTSDVRDNIIKFSKLLQTTPEKFANALSYGFHRNISSTKDENTIKAYTQVAALVTLVFSPDSKKYDDMKGEMKKINELKDSKHEKNEKLIKILDKYNSVMDVNKELSVKYAERKKIVDHKKRLAEIKQLALTDPEQALKDAAELNAELKEKEALASGKQLSKAAQKKANAVAKKAAAEKQAEAPVINAQSSLKTKGTYGKKLEDFFASNGQPILQKFTGDTSKIKDIEKDEIIPNEEVTFNDGLRNWLRKACTLDLYNNKFVFEIKNYVNNSIDDDVIPMQPSKFAGTEYFKPRYLKDGSLYSLNLNYTSPITGIHHTQNVLPANTNGREVVFIIRLKEGLYQYKPFLDHKNTSIIPTGETTQDGRPLYFFKSTKLKECLDYNDKPAFNLKGHLTRI